MSKSSATKEYLKEVKKHCPNALKDRLINDLSDSLEEFEKENPCCKKSDISNRFGESSEFICEYIEAMDGEDKIKTFRKNKHLKIIIFVLALIIAGVVLWIGLDNTNVIGTFVDGNTPPYITYADGESMIFEQLDQ